MSDNPISAIRQLLDDPANGVEQSWPRNGVWVMIEEGPEHDVPVVSLFTDKRSAMISALASLEFDEFDIAVRDKWDEAELEELLRDREDDARFGSRSHLVRISFSQDLYASDRAAAEINRRATP